MSADERIGGVGGRRRRRLGLGRGTRPQRQWRRKVLAALLRRTDDDAASVDLRSKIALARQGFLPVSHELYDLGSNDARRYLTDYEHELTYEINGDARWVLEDKVLFTCLAGSLGVPVAPVLAIIAAGEPRWLGRDPSRSTRSPSGVASRSAPWS